jgi:hypothetical protein
MNARVHRTAPGCASRSLWGWSPPPLPAETSLERLADRLLPRTGLTAALFFGSVIALLLLAPHLDRHAELLLDGVAALAAGTWCGLNFWRCRHAHCAVDAAGWLPLAAFAFFEAAVGRTLIHGYEQVVFLVVLGAGLAFEGVWYLARGSNSCVGQPDRPA